MQILDMEAVETGILRHLDLLPAVTPVNLTTYCMSKKSWANFNSNVLDKMGQKFLDVQYIIPSGIIIFIQTMLRMHLPYSGYNYLTNWNV